MQSHTYSFTFKKVAAHLAVVLVPLGLFSLGMHFGAAASLLPGPFPALDTDRTILVHQAEASRRADAADVLLIGDSSCLMNVSALELGRGLEGSKALNLGTLSYLDLEAFGLMLEKYLAVNAGELRAVVLLMHPEALRRPDGTDYHTQSLLHYYSGLDYCGPGTERLFCALGVEIFRGRILSRAVPRPLPGAFGRYYGFTHDLWKHLSKEHGSALDPNVFDPTTASGPAEYRLARNLEVSSHNFRQIVPEGVALIVGITPVPESQAGAGFEKRRAEMLETFGKWLKADVCLNGLPSTFPDALFASSTHLNADGVVIYTELLARALSDNARRKPR
jgi:hypothetical protein